MEFRGATAGSGMQGDVRWGKREVVPTPWPHHRLPSAADPAASAGRHVHCARHESRCASTGCGEPDHASRGFAE
ncbi:hypothetical protein G6F24_014293 [Rhizopus arrhizus]|nr:hypothetical protein G6F24_014293 [Rhizopus arrhizus]